MIILDCNMVTGFIFKILAIFVIFSNQSFAKSSDQFLLNLPVLSKPQILSKTSAFSILDKKIAENNIDYNNSSFDSLLTSLEKQKRKKIIMIDAGHGGKDPGAISYNKRVKEKDVVLSYAKKLKKKIEANSQFKVFLTRNKDKYIPLRSRGKIARKYKADLFISIHADAALNKKARGLSIYTLSERASSVEAGYLARKANKEDVISGLDLTGIEKDISSTLIDLSLRDAKNKSKKFAKILYKNLRHKVRTRNKAINSAGFVVLKNSNMASILLEIGFLTNKYDARNLQKSSYREKIINGINKSIIEYFSL